MRLLLLFKLSGSGIRSRYSGPVSRSERRTTEDFLSTVSFTRRLYLGSLDLFYLSDVCRRLPNQSLERADPLVFDSGLLAGQDSVLAYYTSPDIQGASKTTDGI
jgi:hypothetical protein